MRPWVAVGRSVVRSVRLNLGGGPSELFEMGSRRHLGSRSEVGGVRCDLGVEVGVEIEGRGRVEVVGSTSPCLEFLFGISEVQ